MALTKQTLVHANIKQSSDCYHQALIHQNFSVTVQVLTFNLLFRLRVFLLTKAPLWMCYYQHPEPKGAAIIILPCGPALLLLRPRSSMVMINHPTSNRSALLPLRSLPHLPWAPDDCLMSRPDTIGYRCVISVGQTMFMSSEALRFRVTDIRSHQLTWPTSWLQGWLMRLYWQWEGPVSALTVIQNNTLHTCTASSVCIDAGRRNLTSALKSRRQVSVVFRVGRDWMWRDICGVHQRGRNCDYMNEAGRV